MAKRAFALEDGNIASQPITSTQKVLYTDVDLIFSPRPSGDVFKKIEASAVKQAVKNLLMTNFMERPFNNTFGGNLNSFLFQLDTEIEVEIFRDRIFETIARNEPRATVEEVVIGLKPNYNEVTVTVVFRVNNSIEPITLELSLARTR